MLDSVDAQQREKVDEWAALFQKIFLLPEQAQGCAFGKSIILAYHDFRGCQRGAKGEFFCVYPRTIWAVCSPLLWREIGLYNHLENAHNN